MNEVTSGQDFASKALQPFMPRKEKDEAKEDRDTEGTTRQ